jgi:two-component system KDP operon response regulator KdpE
LEQELQNKKRRITKTHSNRNLLALYEKNEGRVLMHQYILKEIWECYQTETQYLRVFVGTLC